MSIRSRIKSLIAGEDLTMKAVAEELSKKRNKKISADVLSKKLSRDSIRFTEVEEILELLGYEIEFRKK